MKKRTGLTRGALPLSALLFLTGCTAAEASAGPAASELDLDVLAEWQSMHAQFPDAIQPEVEIVRRVNPDDWAMTIADCLQESGYPDVTADADGGLSFENLGTQAEQFALAKYVCVAQFPLEKRFTAKLTDEQLGGLYDYMTLVQTPCLEAQGFDIPAPPSKQRFVETYLTAPEWLPYANIPIDVLQSGGLATVQAVCPEDPPKDSEYYLY